MSVPLRLRTLATVLKRSFQIQRRETGLTNNMSDRVMPPDAFLRSAHGLVS